MIFFSGDVFLEESIIGYFLKYSDYFFQMLNLINYVGFVMSKLKKPIDFFRFGLN